MTNPNQPAPEKCCPTCGSENPQITVKRRCEMMAPPLNWRWLKDDRLTCTDFVECADPWHDALPVEPQPVRTKNCEHSPTFSCGTYCTTYKAAVETVPVVPPCDSNSVTFDEADLETEKCKWCGGYHRGGCHREPSKNREVFGVVPQGADPMMERLIREHFPEAFGPMPRAILGEGQISTASGLMLWENNLKMMRIKLARFALAHAAASQARPQHLQDLDTVCEELVTAEIEAENATGAQGGEGGHENYMHHKRDIGASDPVETLYGKAASVGASSMSAEQFYRDWTMKGHEEFCEQDEDVGIHFAEAYASELKAKIAQLNLKLMSMSSDKLVTDLTKAERERDQAREALRKEYARGRLEQFLRMKKERPIDPTYWDMHEENTLREALAAVPPSEDAK